MRVAVFVDAGYIFAQGSCTITGLKTPKPRDQLEMKEEAIVRLLASVAHTTSSGKELLRIYWYDGAPLSGPSAEQVRLAHLRDVKLRLGFLNAEGQQKGVDSLIVTDLMELARNKAISDAVVVTGDEDIRVGILIAQSHGVRVHVLGIAGAQARGTQSSLLQQEADTVSTWGKSDISGFLAVRGNVGMPAARPSVSKSASPPLPRPARPTPEDGDSGPRDVVQSVIDYFAGDPGRIGKAAAVVKTGKDMPGYVVSVIKEKLDHSLGRRASKAEQKSAREALARRLREMP
ncbi:MAG: NYN domain-containing protein [Rhizobiales bacterium]|nr:NYN domain-containing protein [Hyphomicrobiales bacterium]MBI3673721.1 NYN domain-containing protein [Hyphomicrobiales bacterium]